MRFWLVGKILLHPLRTVQERIDAWVLRRVKRQPGPVQVSRRRVYIVPTRYGYVFALLLLVMLLGAMNYSNSMAFALTFLLSALGLVCMHHTHANLVNLQLRALRLEPVFTGELAHFELQLENPSAQARYNILCNWARDEAHARHVHVPATGSASLKLSMVAQRRGWCRGGIFSVATEFPLGLFHAWTWFELDMACLVYPRPAQLARVPPATRGSGQRADSLHSGQDEFMGLRGYQRGDPLRSVHWKSLPKTGALMVKQFAETLGDELWLDWDSLGTLDIESRLSQLTRWVLDAAGGHRPYGLRLPELSLEPTHGPLHQAACLRALALYGAAAEA